MLCSVNFLEKVIELPNAEVTMSIWDLGGALSVVCSQCPQLRAAPATLMPPPPSLPPLLSHRHAGDRSYAAMLPMVCVDAGAWGGGYRVCATRIPLAPRTL